LQNLQPALAKSGPLQGQYADVASQLANVLRNQDTMRAAKFSGTGGGGSQTAMQLMQGEAADKVGEGMKDLLGEAVPGWIKGGWNVAKELPEFYRQRALAQALADPAQMQILLARLGRGPTGLQQTGSAVAEALRQGVSSNVGKAVSQ
jgi:hypothetical protein